MREFDIVSLEAGPGDRPALAHQSQRLLRWGWGWGSRFVFSLKLFLWRASLYRIEIGFPTELECRDDCEHSSMYTTLCAYLLFASYFNPLCAGALSSPSLPLSFPPLPSLTVLSETLVR